jgi:hypothetical protein
MSWTPSTDKLKKFVLNNVNNRLGHDVKEKVMLQVQEFGGCEGIASKLGASLVSGISKETVEDRKEVYGINYVAPPPPTRECLEFIDGIAIFCTVALVVFAGAFQEQQKEAKFRALSEKSSEEFVNVIREIKLKQLFLLEMIVTAVGVHTYQESLLAEKPKDKDPENTAWVCAQTSLGLACMSCVCVDEGHRFVS